MTDSDLKELEELKAELLTGMREFMSGEDEEEGVDDGDADEEFDAGYTEADIQKCDTILQEFVAHMQELGGTATEPEILACVKDVVVKLNGLNEQTDGHLIETDQREVLCEYILTAAEMSGLETDGEDVTEEWREW